MDNYNRLNVFTSLFWKLVERSGAQAIQIIVQIILARLLSPNEFGTMALVLVFLNLSRVFIEGGFNVALIQKKDTDDLDYSSIYVLSIIISIILFAVLFLISPLLANFYNQKNLSSVLRVSGIILFPGALNTVQSSYIAKNLMFKKSAIVSLIATVTSGITGIILAYFSFGIWALILQQIIYMYLYVYLLQWRIKWKPKFIISWDRVRILFSYGSKILGSSLIYRLYLESRTLIIGKFFSAAALGYYQRGEQIPKVLATNIDGSIQSVMLPTLSAKQDDLNGVKSIVRRSLKVSTFLVFPIMFGLAAIAKTLILVLLGIKWTDSTIFLIIFSFTYALWPIITINQQSVRALGRSDIILKTEIIKRVFGILIIILSVSFGVKAIAWGFFMERLIETFINAWPNKKLINYSYSEQILDILPSFINSLVMYIPVFLMNFLDINLVVLLFLQIVVGGTIYALFSIVTKNDSLTYLMTTLASLRTKNR